MGIVRSPRQNRLSAHAGYGNLVTCGDVQASGPGTGMCGPEVCGASGKEQFRGFGTRVGASLRGYFPARRCGRLVPPRMVGPYMSGQRGVIAGYVHRVRDIVFRNTADAFYALGLGYEGSDFKPDMSEMYFLCWQAREIDGYVPVTRAACPAEPGVLPGADPDTRRHRPCAGWRTRRGTSRPVRRAGLAAAAGRGETHAIPADGLLPRRFLSGRGRPFRPRRHAVRRPAAAGRARLLPGPRRHLAQAGAARRA